MANRKYSNDPELAVEPADGDALVIRDVSDTADGATGTMKKLLWATIKALWLRHDLATAANDFLVASGAGAFVKKTLAETRTILSISNVDNTSDINKPVSTAQQTAIDTAVVGLLDFKGSTDASTNPNYPSALKGDAYVVSVAGKVGGASGTSVEVGDWYVATANNAGGTEASVGTSWAKLEHNVLGALIAANNLSELTNQATARTNIGMSANGSSLVSAADYAAMRTLLGLVISTDVQAYHARLADLAGITYVQGDTFYFNGSNIVKLSPGTSGQFLKTLGAGANPLWATIPGGGDLLSTNNLSDLTNQGTARTNLGMSANGSSFVTAADYAAMRTLLGLVISTNVQAYSSVLTTLAGATANGQSLVTAANYAAMKALLDLEIGTDVQAYNAVLTTLAGATANGQSLVTATDYAAMLTLLFGVDAPENAVLTMDDALSADGKYSAGDAEDGIAGEALSFGHLCRYNSSSKWVKTDADTVANTKGKAGFCVLAAAGDTSVTKILRRGKIRADAIFPTMTIGDVMYASTTAGEITATAPSATNNAVRIVGFSNTTDELDIDISPNVIKKV